MTWTAGDTPPPIRLPLTLRRAVQAVAGTRDYYPFHHDDEFAKANGVQGMFFNTMFLQAFAGRAVNEWFGFDAFLRKLDVAMVGSNYIDRTLEATGTVTAVREVEGITLVDGDLTLATDDGVTTRCTFTIQLPVAVHPGEGA
ncbi:MAG: MaoC/PaaZ C-terminal domain-containing protein [Dehalococcoidia bacterium]